jgi:outer membrane protein TolC
MKWSAGLAALLLIFTAGGRAQTFPLPNYFSQLVTQVPPLSSVPGPKALRDYIVNGSLQLRLDDAVRLALLNNTNIRLERLQVNQAQYNLLGAYAPFDPLLTDSFTSSRSVIPATNTLQGAVTTSSYSQFFQSQYSQMFQTGTNYTLGFDGSKGVTNSTFYFFNPYLSSTLTFQVSQPLLRGRGLFANRAPIIIAQKDLAQSRLNFEASVDTTLQRVTSDYWDVIEAQESLIVAESQQAEAQASYDHDERSLKLGAISPLNIYQSESQVAQVKVQVIQQEYVLKQAESQLRQDIGADLDPYVNSLPLKLVENPNPQGTLLAVNRASTLKEAFQRRPEILALQAKLEADETNIRYQHNQLLPNLALQGTYASNGIGGDELLPGPPPVVIPGGFTSSLGQLFRFKYPTYGVGVTLTLPIKNHAAEEALGEATVSREDDLYSLREEQETVQLDVINAVQELEESKLALAAARTSRDLAKKNLAAQQEEYKLGSSQIYFVLAAQTQLATAEDSLVQAEVGYQLAVVNLAYANGTLPDHFNVRIAP